jgi:hypothetical protein
MNAPFKQCSLCGKEWRTKEEFLGDRTLALNGHQHNRKKISVGGQTGGLLIFTHLTEECGTSLAIAVSLCQGIGGQISSLAQ